MVQWVALVLSCLSAPTLTHLLLAVPHQYHTSGYILHEAGEKRGLGNKTDAELIWGNFLNKHAMCRMTMAGRRF